MRKNKLKKSVLRAVAVPTAMALLVGFNIELIGAIQYGNGASAATSSDQYYYYQSDYNSAEEVRDAATRLNRDIAAEGMVLLKNDDYLPMRPATEGGKINVSIFGKSSADIAFFGYGSSDSMAIGGDWTRQSRPFYEAFDNSVFNVNPTLKAFYENDSLSGKGRLDGNYHGSLDGYRAGLPTGETPYSSYTAEVINSYSQYKDAAIVMLTRVRGEGSDLPKTSLKSWGGSKLESARNGDDHYLQLDAYEVKMLQEVLKNFNDVVILLNASGPMEVGFLNDPTHYLYTDNDYTSTAEEAEVAMHKIKAAISVGLPGTDGCFEIPRVLSGEVTPSGHLADTWVYDMKKDPTWQNQGYNGAADGCHYGAPYVHYDEDIYLGYRYYETRYAEEGKKDLADGEEWYAGQVQYPFGYGLSYTTFDWELVSCENSGNGNELEQYGTIVAKVKVTNTGDYSGKEVVQLYYSTPYYTGGISKAHVVLGGFAKTGLLIPGQSETVEIAINVSDMYSYDWSDANENGFKGYELEHGEYKIVVASDAHQAAERAASRQADDFTKTYNISEDFLYENDTTSGAPVGNLFDSVSGTGKTNDPETFCGVRVYMSRDDFEGTFPTPASAKKSGKRQQAWSYSISNEFDQANPWYSEEAPVQAETAGTAETNTIKLWHLRGRDYDDPLWDAFLNQLTVQELVSQIENGFFGTRPIASVDKPSTYDDDGPLGRRHCPDVQWVDNTTLAQTFNAELAFALGVMNGEAALWGVNHAEGSNMMTPPSGLYGSKPEGRGGTYGLGLNTHRSPFGGRNFEYFSEDGLLAGKMAAQVAKGSLSKGCYQISKHIFMNDQETERGSIQTWASEQAIREIYAKPFEIAIKEGGLNALMAGVNSVGNIPCSQNWAVLTGLIRNEWGFRGFVITDLVRYPVDMCIRAGCNTMMVHNQLNTPATDAASLTATQLTAIRESAKSVLYTVANSNGVQGFGGEPLSAIEYGGVNTLYAVQGVSNDLSANSAEIALTGDTDLIYSLKNGSSLPEGMTLGENGILTGAPEQPGEYTFTVNADEKIAENSAIAYPYKTASKTFKLKVYAHDQIPDTIIFDNDMLETIPVGFEYSQSIRSAVVFDAEGKLTSDVTYSLTEDSELPRGLKLEDGFIQGVCTAPAGKYFFTVRAEAAGRKSVELDFIVRVKEYKIEYVAQALPEMDVGKSVYLSLADATSAEGLNIQYALKEGDSLPEGLTLSKYGILSGTPIRAYTDCEFTVVASAELAAPVETTYKITVYGIRISDLIFERVLIGKGYLFRLNATPNDGGSASSITYRLKEGSVLPAGFSLSSDGILTGIGTEIGEQSFTVVVEAEGYESVEAVVTLDLYGIFEDGTIGDVDGTPMETPPTNGTGSGCNGYVNGGSNIIVGLSALAVTAAVVIFIRNKKKSINEK